MLSLMVGPRLQTSRASSRTDLSLEAPLRRRGCVTVLLIAAGLWIRVTAVPPGLGRERVELRCPDRVDPRTGDCAEESPLARKVEGGETDVVPVGQVPPCD